MDEHTKINANDSILIVDDNPKNLQVIGALLNTEGYKLAMANSGEKALHYLTKKRADLILLDIMMPGMDGYEVCMRLKENPDTKDIPVIFLTAKTETKDILKGFQIGGVDYVTKPFNKEEILARIKTHIELKKSKDKILVQNQQLEESEESLRISNKTKDKFFSIIAHDLKNPIAGFYSLSEMLKRDYHDMNDEEKLDFISLMHSSAKGLFSLLENLLNWSRAQTGTVPYEPDILQVHQIVKDTFEVMKLNADKKGIKLKSDIGEDIVAYGDANMITTVIRNLVSNALKFTNEGGEVRLSSKEMENLVEISVSDTGIGMSPENMAKLFRIDVHHSSLGTNEEKGTGLGLILCKEFVEKNGGKITVKSEEHIGTTFTFSIPKNKL